MSTETLDVESVPSQALTRRSDTAITTPMSVQEIVGQVGLIQQVMKSVMKEGEHYGKIPGCGDKPALLKAGAEKLGMTFRLAPAFDVTKTDLNGGHREYAVICTLNGKYQGVGTCSTMEGKYRYRTGPKKPTDRPVPKQYWDIRQSEPAKAQALLGGKGFSTTKVDGVWMICEQGEKVEHDNPADHFNTVLKMAKKRAHVDAILTATAASDIFVQDEDLITGANAEPSEDVETDKTPPRAVETKKATVAPVEHKQDEFEIKKADEPWRTIPVPFGKDAGKTFGDLPKNTLWWWATQWKPSPYKGVIKDADLVLRDLLDEVKAKYFDAPKPANPAPDDSDAPPF